MSATKNGSGRKKNDDIE
jgi:DNA topoisomerase-2